MSNPSTFKIIFFALIFLAAVLEAIGDFWLKKWSMGGENSLLWLGIILYLIGSAFWIVSLRYEYLSKAVSLFTVLNAIILIVVGVVVFKEDLSFINKIGLTLGVLSVILIEL